MYNKQYVLNCAVIGEAGSGKSSLCARLHKNQFVNYYKSTIGAAFIAPVITHPVPPTEHVHATATTKLELWDTSGNVHYHGLLPWYLRDAHLVLVTVDLSSNDEKKWEEAQSFIQEAQKQSPEAHIYIVGTKSDLLESEQKTLAEQTKLLESFTRDNKCNGHFISSAKTQTQVEVQDCFKKAIIHYHESPHAPRSRAHTISAYAAAAPHSKSKGSPAATAQQALVMFIAAYRELQKAECSSFFNYLFSCFRRYNLSEDVLNLNTNNMSETDAKKNLQAIGQHGLTARRFLFFNSRTATAIENTFGCKVDFEKDSVNSLICKMIKKTGGSTGL